MQKKALAPSAALNATNFAICLKGIARDWFAWIVSVFTARGQKKDDRIKKPLNLMTQAGNYIALTATMDLV